MDTNQGYKILEHIMDKLDPKIDGSSKDIVQENIDKLKRIFPDVFTESKVDFEKLKETLGDYIEDREERYSFVWHGKSMARRIAQTPSTGTLRPCKEESKDWETTQNLFIEGDNLEVLKLLQKSYHKKIKMIYIDPPYNTGKEFIYPDNYKDNLDTYLRYTNQIDAEGYKFSSNTEQSGRYHTNWLNMMYPRLKLARNLLRDAGIIFISIDDNEQNNLKKVCDEIFGEDNFIAKYIHKNNSSKNQAKLVSVSTEYFYCYSKNRKALKDKIWRLKKKGAEDIAKLFLRLKKKGFSVNEIEPEIKEMYRRPKYAHLSRWNKVDDNGVFKDADLSREGGPKNYTITNPVTGEDCVVPGRGWGKSKEELLKLQKDDLIWYGSDDTPPGLKDYINPDDISVPDSFWYYDNSVDTRWVKNEFGSLVFENPKPLAMLKDMIEMIGIYDNDIILDFFAGSCTSAHATLDLNKEDRGNRKFIMIQLPELCGEKSKAFLSGYKTIADIGKERIRYAGDRIVEENQDKEGIENLDIGFKVFKLDSSNIKPWDADFDHLEDALWDSVNNIKADRTEADVLYELLLKYGLDLTLPIEEREINGKTVFLIGLGALVICLDSDITIDVVEGIGKLKAELDPEIMRVVFKDSGFKNDVVKTNAIQILKQSNIEDVKSL
jgi:adenine-specific DNA-methyltransferase